MKMYLYNTGNAVHYEIFTAFFLSLPPVHMKQQGFTFDYTETNINKLCICVICLSPLNNPRTAECGHSFCLDCVSEWLVRTCPSCSSQINSESDLYTADRTLQCLLNELLVRCSNKSKKCPWIGSRGNLTEHLDNAFPG